MNRTKVVLFIVVALFLAACTDPQAPPKQKHEPKPPVALEEPVIGSDKSPPVPLTAPKKLRSKPNIVEVMADDMRYDDLQYAPNLQRLMRGEATFMANAFAAYPLCCPARAAFFSGQLTHNHHVYTVKDPYAYGAFDDRQTLATSLKQAGYSTAFIGKYLNEYGAATALAPKLAFREQYPDRKANEAPRVESQNYVPDGWDEWRAGLQGNWCQPACGGAYHYFQYAWSHNGVPKTSKRGRYSSDVMSRQARNLIGRFSKIRRKRDNPFFVSLNFIGPHTGSGGKWDQRKLAMSEDSCYAKMPAAPNWAYEAKSVRRIDRGGGIRRNGLGERSIKDKPGDWARFPRFTPCDLTSMRRNTISRAAAVHALDKNVGEVVAKLKRNGEWRRTVFVFTSDNGYFLGEHRRPQGKIAPYEPSLRVPLIIAGPGVKHGGKGLWRGRDVMKPVEIVDLTATLLDYAAAAPPHELDGRSFRKALEGQDQAWLHPVPYEAVLNVPTPSGIVRTDEAFKRNRNGIVDPRNAIGLRTGRYLYVRYSSGVKELYDLWADPHQWSNLAKDEEWLTSHTDVVEELDQAWVQLQNCRGEACKPMLTNKLALSVRDNREATAQWYRVMRSTYGFDKR